MNDEDRIAYLAGEDRPLDTDDRAELDELRAMLGDPSIWADPTPDLEDRVVAAIGTARAAPARQVATRRPMRWRVVGVAAALLIAIGIGVTLANREPSGEHFTLALAAPAGAATVDGHADFLRTDAGWRIKLDASGLPRLDSGRFYQAWMRNADGTLVPIGTFNEGKSVTLWAGVSPHDYPTLTVTEEAADGNQASSGKRVLAGTLAFGG